jgi:GTP-binding protein HflX
MKDSDAMTVFEEGTKVEHAFLVAVQGPDSSAERCEELLAELGELIRTLGLSITGQLIVKLREINPRLYVGEGKAQEIREIALQSGADVIVFDDFLSPSQQRNWEELADMAVIDRQEVILDIFAERAHSSEARLQVELARANYSLPRLKRLWTHLHRQHAMAGGMGMRGEGEQQLEVDSRLVRARIAKLKTQLKAVRQHRQVQRSQRLRRPVPVAAIVGYTNAGKSSLLNALTQATVLTEDKLFATLDPTVRRLELPDGQALLMADTVGFIRKLPHLLVEAFHSTLEETAMADYLVEVLDATATNLEEHHDTTAQVLEEIGAGGKPTLLVLNKIDALPDELSRQRLQRRFPDALLLSATCGDGIEELRQAMAELCRASMTDMALLIPHSRYDQLSLVRKTCAILSESYEDVGVRLKVRVPKAAMASISAFSE